MPSAWGCKRSGALRRVGEWATDGMLGALDGNRDFDDFYRSEYGRLLALAVALCRDRAAAEDVVQDAFLAAHRKWEVVSGYDAPAAFVRRVVINRSRSRFRRRARERDAMNRLASRSSGCDEASPIDVDSFWVLVRTLPAQQARCIALRYVDDLDVAAIAAVLGCAEPTVRVHLHRAHRSLASRLELEAD